MSDTDTDLSGVLLLIFQAGQRWRLYWLPKQQIITQDSN